MGKTSVATHIAAQAIAAELGVKPSRTVVALQALASTPRDFAPRKGSEGRRPQVKVVAEMTDEELWDMCNSDGFFHKFDVECECNVCNSLR